MFSYLSGRTTYRGDLPTGETYLPGRTTYRGELPTGENLAFARASLVVDSSDQKLRTPMACFQYTRETPLSLQRQSISVSSYKKQINLYGSNVVGVATM